MGRFSKNFPERAMYIFVSPTKMERENEESSDLVFYIENNHLGASMIDYKLFPPDTSSGLGGQNKMKSSGRSGSFLESTS